MSGKTSETRCKHCQRRIAFSGNYWLQVETNGYLSGGFCLSNPNGRHEPTSAGGEAVPEQKDKFCVFCGKTDHTEDGHKHIPGPRAVPNYCRYCGVQMQCSVGGAISFGTHKDNCPRNSPAAPVVSTAAPEPPLRISFDIGGVLSKYPEVFRPMVDALQKGGAEVFVITDMHEHDKSVCFVRGNGYDIPSERILNSDYTAHGEGCKAETIRQHGIKIHLDDFAGYCAHTECVSLLVWPNPLKPYYADDFKTDGTEGDFGRRKAAKI